MYTDSKEMQVYVCSGVCYVHYTHLLDVAGKSFVEVLHVFLLSLPRTLDGRDSGLRHHGVRSGRRSDVAIVTGPLDAAAGRRAGTRVRRTVDDEVTGRHHCLVDRSRRLRLVRRASLVRRRLDAGALRRTLTRDANLGHVDQRIPAVMNDAADRYLAVSSPGRDDDDEELVTGERERVDRLTAATGGR